MLVLAFLYIFSLLFLVKIYWSEKSFKFLQHPDASFCTMKPISMFPSLDQLVLTLNFFGMVSFFFLNGGMASFWIKSSNLNWHKLNKIEKASV